MLQGRAESLLCRLSCPDRGESHTARQGRVIALQEAALTEEIAILEGRAESLLCRLRGDYT